MPIFDWASEVRGKSLTAFANVETGISRKAHTKRKRREDALKAEVEKLKASAESNEERLRTKERQLATLKRNRFQLRNPEPEQDRIETFRKLLSPLPAGRLLDLGCGHGKFSVAAAELGWRVTGVDARTDRMPDDESVEWVRSDVREYAFDAADFDVISVLGLLYHLEQPAQMDLLSRCTGTLTILDTRIGLDRGANENGYEGEHYEEPGKDEEERKTKLLASWGNARSFWPTEESLIKMARDAGFSLVAPVRPPRRKYRTFYLCYP